MRREKIITFRVSEEEYLKFLKLIQLLQRTKSDAIRYVLTQALKKLENENEPSQLVAQN